MAQVPRLQIQTYRHLKMILSAIDEEHLDDNITVMEDGEFYPKVLDLYFSDETHDQLDMGHPYFISMYR